MRYLTLKYANLPIDLSPEERQVMEAGIRRCLTPMLFELEAVDSRCHGAPPDGPRPR